MASFPEKANVVIIGLGGIVGSSVAHHLIAKGWKNIVGDRQILGPHRYRVYLTCF